MTPPVTGILPGITRGHVLGCCGELQLAVQERAIARAQLAAADEIFITSAVRGIVAVTRLDGRSPDGTGVGVVTKELALGVRRTDEASYYAGLAPWHVTLGNCARKRRKLPPPGKYKRALGAYLQLETLEPRDAQWAKRAGETYRKLNRKNDAIVAFNRSADRYAQDGFLVQAIAVCKLILQIDPSHDAAVQRIAAMNAQIGAGPTRALTMAEDDPALADEHRGRRRCAGAARPISSRSRPDSDPESRSPPTHPESVAPG